MPGEIQMSDLHLDYWRGDSTGNQDGQYDVEAHIRLVVADTSNLFKECVVKDTRMVALWILFLAQICIARVEILEELPAKLNKYGRSG